MAGNVFLLLSSVSSPKGWMHEYGTARSLSGHTMRLSRRWRPGEGRGRGRGQEAGGLGLLKFLLKAPAIVLAFSPRRARISPREGAIMFRRSVRSAAWFAACWGCPIQQREPELMYVSGRRNFTSACVRCVSVSQRANTGFSNHDVSEQSVLDCGRIARCGCFHFRQVL